MADDDRERARALEASLRLQIQHLLDLNKRDRDKLNRLYASKTWKAGRLAYRTLAALRAPKDVARALKHRRKLELPLEDPPPAPISVARYPVRENAQMRTAYERAVAKRAFTGEGRKVAFAVHTLDLDQGRGDVYVAVGLGRYLERIGYDVVYLARDEWYAVPQGTEVYVALLDEVDLFRLGSQMTRIAWIRNRTTQWIASPSLPLYDAVLSSSNHSLAEVRRSYPGPSGLLRIGVDHELFSPSLEAPSRHGVVTTVNQWGTERELFRALSRCDLDFPLALYGEQRGLNAAMAPYWQGMLSFFALPSLYAQAALVLDDHNHTTQPFGNVNSRVYEALACGAPLVTNSSLGLAEIGLEDVPTYTTPEELDRIIHDAVGDPEGSRPATKALQRKVLDDHTFERRAEQMDTFLRELDRVPAGDRVVVGFFPDYRAANPYQSMLYGWNRSPSLAAVPVPPPQFLERTSLLKRGERFVYHLHWTAPVLAHAKTEDQARERLRAFVDGIDAIRSAGASFVWTIHNVIPHESRFPAFEAELGRALAQRADAIHVMCEDTAALVAASYPLPAERVHVLPHPSYAGVYPNAIRPAMARAELGLGEDDTVLCFFGGIRRYKGIELLLDVFEEVSRTDDRLRLIVAGPTERLDDVEDLRLRCASDPRIVSNFNRIADGDVQIFLNAADVVVLPHRAVLNSGSLLLALSFGRPVIAPMTGCVRDLLTPDVSLTFEAGDPASLRDALARVDVLRSPEARQAAMAKAAAYDAGDIARGFEELIGRVVGR